MSHHSKDSSGAALGQASGLTTTAGAASLPTWPGAASAPASAPATGTPPGHLWEAQIHKGELRARRARPGTPADLWLSDNQGDQVHGFRVRRVLHSGRTGYAQADVVDSYAYGKLLSLDGLPQSSAADEASYHEALVAPAFVLATEPLRRVAILGGGEGATLREVLRFPEVRACVMVDIDEELVALCRLHLPEWSAGAFDDPRATLRTGDARAFLEETAAAGQVYDLILCDLPEAEVGTPLQGLYSRRFFELLARCLSPWGLYAGQIGSLQTPKEVLGPTAILPTIAAAFAGRAYGYSRFIPSYWGEWFFGLAGPGLSASGPFLSAARVDHHLQDRRAEAWPCRTYDGQTHQRLFHLPKDLRALLSCPCPLIEDPWAAP